MKQALRIMTWILACLAGYCTFKAPLIGRTAIFECKAAYARSIDTDVTSIYPGGAPIWGSELSIEIGECSPWYAFCSIDYFQKKGSSLGACTPTKLSVVPISLGAKYLTPLGTPCIQGYLGLGFQGAHVRTTNCSPFVISPLSRWATGGITKAGLYWFFSHHIVLDTFFEYSFIKTGRGSTWTPGIQMIRADMNRFSIGAALGYRF